jgi:hypothetical protein
MSPWPLHDAASAAIIAAGSIALLEVSKHGIVRERQAEMTPQDEVRA